MLTRFHTKTQVTTFSTTIMYNQCQEFEQTPKFKLIIYPELFGLQILMICQITCLVEQSCAFVFKLAIFTYQTIKNLQEKKNIIKKSSGFRSWLQGLSNCLINKNLIKMLKTVIYLLLFFYYKSCSRGQPLNVVLNRKVENNCHTLTLRIANLRALGYQAITQNTLDHACKIHAQHHSSFIPWKPFNNLDFIKRTALTHTLQIFRLNMICMHDIYVKQASYLEERLAQNMLQCSFPSAFLPFCLFLSHLNPSQCA